MKDQIVQMCYTSETCTRFYNSAIFESPSLAEVENRKQERLNSAEEIKEDKLEDLPLYADGDEMWNADMLHEDCDNGQIRTGSEYNYFSGTIKELKELALNNRKSKSLYRFKVGRAMQDEIEKYK